MTHDLMNDDGAARFDGQRAEDAIHPRLVHLDDAKEFRIAKGEADIRGWDLRLRDGQCVGKVSDLLIDTGQMAVRFMEAKLNKDFTGTGSERTILIPVAAARLDHDEDDVIIDAAALDLHGLPTYERLRVQDTEVVAEPAYDDERQFGRPGEARDDARPLPPLFDESERSGF